MLPVSLPALSLGAVFHVITGKFSGEYFSHSFVSLGSILKAAKLPDDDSRWLLKMGRVCVEKDPAATSQSMHEFC